MALIRTLKKHNAQSIKKEVKVSVRGEPAIFQVTISLLRDEKNNDLGMVLVLDDLTVMANAQRAAAWREVARRIAHEIKNPLTPIQLSAQRLEKKFANQISDPAFRDCIRMIIEQVDSMKNLVNEFNNFARLPQAKPRMAFLNKVLQEALVLYQTGHKDITFEFQSDEKTPEFEFDPEQITRVIVNLLENAVAAVENQSVRKVALTTHYDSLLKIVQINVTDSGAGIPEQNRSHVFEPYFSTKSQGTGLGLAIVKRIVEDHSGFVRAYSNEPTGTRFVIELPVLQTAGAVVDSNN